MSTEVVAASNMTTAVLEASHEIAAWIELSVRLIEALSVIIIVLAILYSTYVFIRRIRGHKGKTERKPVEEYKDTVGQYLLLTLEILVAADVIETVAFSKTMESVVLLGVLVLVRILLGWSIMVEMEGTWPWKRAEIKNKE